MDLVVPSRNPIYGTSPLSWDLVGIIGIQDYNTTVSKSGKGDSDPEFTEPLCSGATRIPELAMQGHPELAVAYPSEPTLWQLDARINGLRNDLHHQGLALHAVALKSGANEGDCTMLRARTTQAALDSHFAKNLVPTLEEMRVMQDKIRLLEEAIKQNVANVKTVESDMERERNNTRNNYVTDVHLERTFATRDASIVYLKAITEKMHTKVYSSESSLEYIKGELQTAINEWCGSRLAYIKGNLQTAIHEWMAPILFRMQEVADNYQTLVAKVAEVQHNVDALPPALPHLPMSDLLCSETLSDIGDD